MTILLVMSVAVMVIVYVLTKESMIHECEERYQGIILHENEKIRGVLSDVYVGTINNINDIETDLDNPAQMQAHLERMIRLNMYMSSCRLIFKSDFYPQKGSNFEIYAWRDSTGAIKSRQLNEQNQDFIYHTWYEKAFDNNEGDWTPPYFDKAASHQLTTTYMTHIHDRQGQKVAMLGADVSLEWLRLRHKRIDKDMHERFEKGFKEQSYSFIIDNDGTYLIHPDEQRVLKRKIQDITTQSPDTLDDVMVCKMLNGESGIARLQNDGIDSWVFYSFVKYAEWTVVIIVPESIIYHNGRVLAGIIMGIFFLIIIVVYFVCHHVIKKNLKPLTDELEKTAASKVAIEQELKIASDLQQQMLPKVYPPFPERTDIDIFGEVVTAKEVGGDLFDFFIRDEKLYFSIGDVAGKGVPAALVMAVARSMFRSASMMYTSPKQIIESINHSVCQSNDSYMFVTLFMGVLDLKTGHLVYANAGHEPPVLVGNAHTRFLNADNNIPLGLRDDWEYTEQKSLVDKGTTLFLYTDGYTEAETLEHEQFGKKRMCEEALRLSAEHLDSRTFVKTIRKAERTFVNYIPQGDDISLLAIKYLGNEMLGLYHRGISLLNDVQEIPALSIFLGSICEDMHFDDLTTTGVTLAVEEAVVNVMNYAYPQGTRAVMLLEVFADDEAISFELRDEGKPFDPTMVDEVDVNLPADQRPVGGLGVHLMRHYMDDIAYERTNGQNILTMKKNLKK